MHVYLIADLKLYCPRLEDMKMLEHLPEGYDYDYVTLQIDNTVWVKIELNFNHEVVNQSEMSL